MDTGHGICGHKNSFSTGVKVGNYVEDRIGAELAKRSVCEPISKHSEYSANFIQPREMPDKCAHAPAENFAERNMIRQGLSYDLIFEHGQAPSSTCMDKVARFSQTSHDIGRFLPSHFKGNLPNNDVTRRMQIENKRAREAREQRNMYLSTSQAIVSAHTTSRR